MGLDGTDGRATDVAGSPDNRGNHGLETSKSTDRYTRERKDKIRTRSNFFEWVISRDPSGLEASNRGATTRRYAAYTRQGAPGTLGE